MIKDQKYKIALITSRYANPKFSNKDLDENQEFTKYSTRCVDKITIKVEKENDLWFFLHKTSGCAICIASSDIMIENINNKREEEINQILETYHQLILGNIKSDKELNDLNIFNNVKAHLNRFDCANLIYLAVKEVLQK